MPYEGSDVVAVVILPDRDQDLDVILQDELSPAVLEEILGVPERRVGVHMPRFRVVSDLDLMDYCISRGADLPFDNEGRAGFPGISDSVYVSQFLQRAKLECDEEGTKGAAATMVQFEYLGIGGPGHGIPQFVADRPFAFFVVHKPAQCVLFAAIVARPELMERQSTDQ